MVVKDDKTKDFFACGKLTERKWCHFQFSASTFQLFHLEIKQHKPTEHRLHIIIYSPCVAKNTLNSWAKTWNHPERKEAMTFSHCRHKVLENNLIASFSVALSLLRFVCGCTRSFLFIPIAAWQILLLQCFHFLSRFEFSFLLCSR